MKLPPNKKNKYYICLGVVLAVSLAAGIFFSRLHKTAREQEPADIQASLAGDIALKFGPVNKTGNAGYYNEKDGEYYEDAGYKIRANDNTSYLLSLFAAGKPVKLGAGNYLCRTGIVLNGKKFTVSGIKGRTKIIFDSKNYMDSGMVSFKESLIVNKSYANEYDEESAQSISLSGIIFEYRRYSYDSPKTIMLFKNIKKAEIKKCSFIADLGNGIPVTNLDLYNGCKNVTVRDCFFSNRTKAGSGGCIWVRNLTAQDVRKKDNTTENINIEKCSFEKDSKDEVIAVYSSVGDVKNVVIENCDIKDYAVDQEVVLSVYSSEDRYYGTVDGVKISRNTIYSQNFKAFVIMTGIEKRSKPTSNITIAGNKIRADSKSAEQKIIIYNAAANKNSNVLVKNNEIRVAGSGYVGIANAGSVYGNKLSGDIETGIYKQK